MGERAVVIKGSCAELVAFLAQGIPSLHAALKIEAVYAARASSGKHEVAVPLGKSAGGKEPKQIGRISITLSQQRCSFGMEEGPVCLPH